MAESEYHERVIFVSAAYFRVNTIGIFKILKISIERFAGKVALRAF